MIKYIGINIALILFTSVNAFSGVHSLKEAPATLLAENGVAKQVIYLGEQTDSKTVGAADKLAEILKKMSGANFEIKRSKTIPATGIVIAAVSDFPDLSPELSLPAEDPATRQGYLIVSDGKRLLLLGATTQGVANAVADLLYRLGYRQFFAGSVWEVVSQTAKIEFAGRVTESPDFLFRNIWPGYGIWPEETASQKHFNLVNRHVGEYLDTGHMYEAFIARNRTEFAAHPEYYALVNGKRESISGNTKLCISNPGLRALMVDYIRKTLKSNPEQTTVSMEPSDGGNWCQCAECAKLGSPSTRAVYLANTVAGMMRQEFPGKRIGMYAYGEHSPPPQIEVAPEVIITVATAFIGGGYTYDQLADGWRKHGVKELGTRDYHDVLPWSYWAPGKSKGSNTEYCSKELEKYYAKGSRYYSSEGGWVFGQNGLGYFISMRVLWNIQEAKQAEAIKQDFFKKAFGTASEPMAKFYELIDGKNKPLLSADLLGRLYRQLDIAVKSAVNDQAALRRLADLTTYVRYVELLQAKNTDNSSKNNFTLLEHLTRMRSNQMLHTYGAYHYYQRTNPKERNQVDWNTAKPFTVEEALAFIQPGISSNPLLTFAPVNFSDEYRPAINLAPTPRCAGVTQRGERFFYAYITHPEKKLELEVTGGLIKHYRNRGNVKINLYQIGGASATGERETLVDSNSSVPPDGKTRQVALKPQNAGLHKITVDDGSDMTQIDWKPTTPMIMAAGVEHKLSLPRLTSFYIYVPKGTKQLGFYTSAKVGSLCNPTGKAVLTFDKNSACGFRDIPVEAGQDGKLWQFKNTTGDFAMLTVPPVAARSETELLLPEEVKE